MRKRGRAAAIILALGSAPASAMHWAGFGSICLSRASSDASELTRQGSFGLEPLVLHIHEDISERSDFMGELAVDHDAAGGGTVLDIERYQIGYRRSDLLNVTAGRMHNVLGYWNTAYHHGSFLQTTEERPLFLRFEDDGGVLPLHIVGAAASGRAEFAPGLLKYDAMAGNGPRLSGVGAAAQLVPGDMETDKRNGRAASFKLSFEPEALPGAGAGVSGDFGQERGYGAADSNLQIARVREDVYAAELYYIRERPEFLAEAYRFQDKGLSGPVVGPSRGATAYYVQLSYGLGKNGAWRPYVRQEGLTRRDDDALFSVLGFQPYRMSLAGVKWMMAARSALKLEWRWHHRPGADFNEEEIQWSFSF